MSLESKLIHYPALTVTVVVAPYQHPSILEIWRFPTLAANCQPPGRPPRPPSYQEYWRQAAYKGIWIDDVSAYWRGLTAPGRFANRGYEQDIRRRGAGIGSAHCLLAAHLQVSPGSSGRARFLLAYALLLALSGFEFDMTKGEIGFHPRFAVFSATISASASSMPGSQSMNRAVDSEVCWASMAGSLLRRCAPMMLDPVPSAQARR